MPRLIALQQRTQCFCRLPRLHAGSSKMMGRVPRQCALSWLPMSASMECGTRTPAARTVHSPRLGRCVVRRSTTNATLRRSAPDRVETARRICTSHRGPRVLRRYSPTTAQRIQRGRQVLPGRVWPQAGSCIDPNTGGAIYDGEPSDQLLRQRLGLQRTGARRPLASALGILNRPATAPSAARASSAAPRRASTSRT